MNALKKNRTLTSIIVLALMVSACASFVKTSYQTLYSVATVVDTARKTYNDFYKKGDVSPELALKVEKAYMTYQGAMTLAVNSVRFYQEKQKAGEKISPAAANASITVAQDAVNLLLNVFTEAGVPKQYPVTIEKVDPLPAN